MPTLNPKTYEPTPSRKVAFLGLGVMGVPMAGHLSLAGHDVCVYNRSAAKAQAWTREFKGRAAATPREAAAGRDIVFCCVGNDDDLRSVMLGADGAFAGMKPGAVLVDHTTAWRMSRVSCSRRRKRAGCISWMRLCRAARAARRTACSR